MTSQTGISWATHTWNPVTGCTKVSSGCAQCYAFQLHDQRHKAKLAGKKLPDQYLLPFETIQLHPERLLDPLSWRKRKPMRVFVNSMSDLFHIGVPESFLDQVFAVMLVASSWVGNPHTFMVLTKRPQRMREYLNSENRALRIAKSLPDIPDRDAWFSYLTLHPLSHTMKRIWLGVSVEDQSTADQRIPILLDCPTGVRFLSCEPLLGPVDISRHLSTWVCNQCGYDQHQSGWDEKPGECIACEVARWTPGDIQDQKPEIQWVIAGGESGRKARPMHPEWARGLLNQCSRANIPFHFKQWGEFMPGQVLYGTHNLESHLRRFLRPKKGDVLLDRHGKTLRLDDLGRITTDQLPLQVMARAGTRATGRSLDGAMHHEFPEVHA